MGRSMEKQREPTGRSNELGHRTHALECLRSIPCCKSVLRCVTRCLCRGASHRLTTTAVPPVPQLAEVQPAALLDTLLGIVKEELQELRAEIDGIDLEADAKKLRYAEARSAYTKLCPKLTVANLQADVRQRDLST